MQRSTRSVNYTQDSSSEEEAEEEAEDSSKEEEEKAEESSKAEKNKDAACNEEEDAVESSMDEEIKDAACKVVGHWAPPLLNDGAKGDLVVYLAMFSAKDGALVYLHVGVILESVMEKDILFYKTKDYICSNNSFTTNCLNFTWRTPAQLKLKDNNEEGQYINWVDTRNPPLRVCDDDKEDDGLVRAGIPSKTFILYIHKGNALKGAAKKPQLKQGVQAAASAAIEHGTHYYTELFRQQTLKGWKTKPTQ